MGNPTPMFPLGIVLLPHAPLPIRAFEFRYLELVRDCLDTTPEFGVALIESGREVGGGDTRFDIGCIAHIVDTVEDPRGFWHLKTIGTRRIRIDRWLADDPYPRAEVEDYPDGPISDYTPDLLAAVGSRLRRVLAQASELGLRVPPANFDLDDDPVVASYELVEAAPLQPLDKLGLLGAVTPDARLTSLADHLTRAEELLASRFGGAGSPDA